MRVAYAGRNGHPYTSIGRLIVAAGPHGPRDDDPGEADGLAAGQSRAGARPLMRLNRSYIFFRDARGACDPEDGPIGGAGIPLTPGRSLAVDRTLWAYGLPFWLEGELPLRLDGGASRSQRLMIAQDTGSAIVGPARGDFFLGSGAEAGTRAGLAAPRGHASWSCRPKPPS